MNRKFGKRHWKRMLGCLVAVCFALSLSARTAQADCNCTGLCQDNGQVADVTGCAASLAECTSSTNTVCSSRNPAEGIKSVACPAKAEPCAEPAGGGGCNGTCGDEEEFNLVASDLPACVSQAASKCGSSGVAEVTFTDTPSIPTVSEWGLIVMTLIGLTVGTILFGRHWRARRPA